MRGGGKPFQHYGHLSIIAVNLKVIWDMSVQGHGRQGRGDVHINIEVAGDKPSEWTGPHEH
tara:strand:- start:399 stop:581 length:183 start_codon:yes stop_codon:yes gene_type:complete